MVNINTQLVKMNVQKFNTPTEAFEALYDEIMENGRDTRFTKAIYNRYFVIENPEERVITTSWRKFSKKYADFEVAWYASQDRSPNIVGEAASIWKEMGKTLNSNYGWQINRKEQLAKVTNILANDIESRRAVVTVYDGKEIDDYEKDTPCCLNFAFNIVDNKLNMTTHFRSQDLVYGFGNDQYTLFEYHRLVYNILSHKRYKDLKMGTSSWFVNDLHIYGRHFNMKK